MKKKDDPSYDMHMEELEKLYIFTFQELYDHIRLLSTDEKEKRNLLICTYAELYGKESLLLQQNNMLEQMKKQADLVAERDFHISHEVIEASYAEEKMRQDNDPKRQKVQFDETTVFLEIEDQVQENLQQEKKGKGSQNFSKIKSLFSWCMFLLSVGFLAIGISKVSHQVKVLKEPFVNSFVDNKVETDPAEKNNYIILNGKVAYLSEIGQVLYSLPVKETEFAGTEMAVERNQEIQKQAGWTYFLPCPEREDTQLSMVSPKLYHTLYRMTSDGKEIEIIDTEVEDYAFWEEFLYVSKMGSIRRIDDDKYFEKRKPGIFVKVENGEFYLYDELGRVLNTESDGNVHYQDRIFEMASNRIVDVKPDIRQKGQAVYELKVEDPSKPDITAIYRKLNGAEEIFVQEKRGIDCFCIVDDWIYYSAVFRKPNSSNHSSRIYRKSLSGNEEEELIVRQFPGRIGQMYYCEENSQIYAEYKPNNKKSNYGVIAVISLSGKMSVLEDKEQRSVRETTGNDVLRFVMAKDDQVFCFWEDNYWESGENPIVKWQDVLVLSDNDRKYLE